MVNTPDRFRDGAGCVTLLRASTLPGVFHRPPGFRARAGSCAPLAGHPPRAFQGCGRSILASLPSTLHRAARARAPRRTVRALRHCSTSTARTRHPPRRHPPATHRIPPRSPRANIAPLPTPAYDARAGPQNVFSFAKRYQAKPGAS